MDKDGVVLNGHILIRRTLILNGLEAIVAIQGSESQTLAYRLLLSGVNLVDFVRINQVVGRNQRTVGDNLTGLELLFTQLGTTDAVDAVAIDIRRNLNEIERNLAQSELRAPLFYEQLHALRVLVARIAHIRTTLIVDSNNPDSREYPSR